MTEPVRDPADELAEREEYEAPPVPGPEASEADAAEQARAVDTETDAEPHVGPEVDEYDAVEQSRVVADDDDYRR